MREVLRSLSIAKKFHSMNDRQTATTPKYNHQIFERLLIRLGQSIISPLLKSLQLRLDDILPR
ncbi:hypothetical protein [Microcoleus sp. F4-D5]|uniref:hypothetical protein n=1 Tax=Microcoleus sp. F4-D5 TaxID=2818760 RepID=UPI002FD61246